MFTFDLDKKIDELKLGPAKPAKAANPEEQTSDPNGPERPARGCYRDFLDFDFNPDEWEITMQPDGSVVGIKRRGRMQGTVCFSIPEKILKSGPTPELTSDHEEWDVSNVQLPLGKNGELVDWQLWVRLDRPRGFSAPSGQRRLEGAHSTTALARSLRTEVFP